MKVISKEILLSRIRNLKRANSEICQKKHLLSHRAVSKCKDSTLLASRHTHDEKCQNHAGKCIAETSEHIPVKIHLLPVFSGVNQKICDIVHHKRKSFPLFLLSFALAEILDKQN